MQPARPVNRPRPNANPASPGGAPAKVESRAFFIPPIFAPARPSRPGLVACRCSTVRNAPTVARASGTVRNLCRTTLNAPTSPSAPAWRAAPGGESQLRQERNLCRNPIPKNLKPRQGRKMPLLFTAPKLNEGVVAAAILAAVSPDFQPGGLDVEAMEAGSFLRSWRQDAAGYGRQDARRYGKAGC